jgi:hypothetical protein
MPLDYLRRRPDGCSPTSTTARFHEAKRTIMNNPQASTTPCETDSLPIGQSEIRDSHLRKSAVLSGSELESEEHVLFVLHPAKAEKGDLL